LRGQQSRYPRARVQSPDAPSGTGPWHTFPLRATTTIAGPHGDAMRCSRAGFADDCGIAGARYRAPRLRLPEESQAPLAPARWRIARQIERNGFLARANISVLSPTIAKE